MDRLFPAKYDFIGMLEAQAEETVKGVSAFVSWLDEGGNQSIDDLSAIEKKADEMRHTMEGLLQEAFETPFDRQDIYGISRQMDQVLNFSYSTAREMVAFGILPDPDILQMSRSLLEGTRMLVDGIHMMRGKGEGAQALIRRIRVQTHEIEDVYIQSMAEVYKSQDAIIIVKKREIYHHLRDAGRNLNATVDVLHRIIVVLS